MNVKEVLDTKISALKDEVVRLEAELAALPVEVHTLEQSVWERIKTFFGHADAPTNPPPAAP